MKSKKEVNPYTSKALTGLKTGKTKDYAAGTPAVTSSLKHVFSQSGVVRGTKALLKLNQKDGFDCPSCAWPDPDEERAMTEFCENGAKAVAAETTKAKVDLAFFKKHSVHDLSKQSDYWLEQQGRLVSPMYLKEGASHYESISWDDAFKLLAKRLNELESVDDGVFYTSGRASNEAAFLYQLFVRQFGTNNLPDCSNMCHESSGSALNKTIGIGKGTVTLDDFYKTDAVFILGQNPGTNHPRMLSALQQCVRNGGKVVSINPLKESGLLGFAHPQEIGGILGKYTPLSDQYLQIRINGDQALLKGIAKIILSHPERLDEAFISKNTEGFDDYKASIGLCEWGQIVSESGLSRQEIEAAAKLLIDSQSAIFCWAMGLTQHKNSVATIQEIVNIQLMLGNLGKPGAGLCPVRGHSNVQGDRTMGIYEKMPEAFLAKLGDVFDFKAPREFGFDVVEAITAMHDKPGLVFFGLGGNFLSATPDTTYTAQALRNCTLTAHVATKLNRSHLVTGNEALILPCLGRSELDVRGAGTQKITVENSMGIVHASCGRLKPASDDLLSEPAIVSHLAEATLAKRSSVDWAGLRENYDLIRNAIESVIPGFNNFNKRLEEEGEFYLPNNAKELDFSHIGGKAKFTVCPMNITRVIDNQLLLMTIRSHDQYNTTIYGLDDRYRGIKNERRVIFLNKEDMASRKIVAEQPVDITSHFEGETREAKLFLAIPYDIPRGCAAAYFPETNVLVPIKSTADESNTPTSKSIIITLTPCS